ncbi:MAG: deaminase [Patescibacteria group bacterium]
MSDTVAIAYVPVLHRGYMRFIEQCGFSLKTLYLLLPDIVSHLGVELEYVVRKDVVRAVPTEVMARALGTLSKRIAVCVLDEETIPLIQASTSLVTMPDEDVSHAFAEKFLPGKVVSFSPFFLRFDRQRVQAREDASLVADFTVSSAFRDRELLKIAGGESVKSGDWWRQVGAVLSRDGEVLLVAHNTHVPHEQMPYVYGDPRSLFKSGQMIETSTAEHAESVLVAEAARRGVRTEGCDLHITTFPCEPCAKIVARAGIKKLFFSSGSYGLNTPDVLKSAGVELVYVV